MKRFSWFSSGRKRKDLAWVTMDQIVATLAILICQAGSLAVPVKKMLKEHYFYNEYIYLLYNLLIDGSSV